MGALRTGCALHRLRSRGPAIGPPAALPPPPPAPARPSPARPNEDPGCLPGTDLHLLSSCGDTSLLGTRSAHPHFPSELLCTPRPGWACPSPSPSGSCFTCF